MRLLIKHWKKLLNTTKVKKRKFKKTLSGQLEEAKKALGTKWPDQPADQFGKMINWLAKETQK
nr:hypothetical protein [Mycoplasmopsis bovis]